MSTNPSYILDHTGTPYTPEPETLESMLECFWYETIGACVGYIGGLALPTKVVVHIEEVLDYLPVDEP